MSNNKDMPYGERFLLGERQKMIMKCFWDNGGSITGPEIMAELKEKFGVTLTKSATNCLIKTLINRGYVELEAKGRYAYRYRATVAKEELQLLEFNLFVESTYFGDGDAMLVSFMKADVTGDSIRKARESIRKARNE